MKSNFVLILISCVFAGSCYAQAAPAKQQQINLDWRDGAEYFKFPEGAQAKVTSLICPPNSTVNITCRTASHGRCGSWYLGINETATAGARGDTGIANLNFNGPRGTNCSATVVVQSP